MCCAFEIGDTFSERGLGEEFFYLELRKAGKERMGELPIISLQAQIIDNQESRERGLLIFPAFLSSR